MQVTSYGCQRMKRFHSYNLIKIILMFWIVCVLLLCMNFALLNSNHYLRTLSELLSFQTAQNGEQTVHEIIKLYFSLCKKKITIISQNDKWPNNFSKVPNSACFALQNEWKLQYKLVFMRCSINILEKKSELE